MLLYMKEIHSVTALKNHRKREELQNPCGLKFQILNNGKEILTPWLDDGRDQEMLSEIRQAANLGQVSNSGRFQLPT